MRITLIIFFFLFCSTVVSQKMVAVEDMTWMSGCWKMERKSPDSFVYESWSKPYGIMLGTNMTVKNGKASFFEYLRIEMRKDGVYYVARPAGAKSETPFKLVSTNGGRFVFENKEHDFPKRIIYSKGADGVMSARVEDDNRGFGLKFKNIPCSDA